MTTATPQRLTAILYREDEVYVAECPEVGTASQGDTIEEALANLREGGLWHQSSAAGQRYIHSLRLRAGTAQAGHGHRAVRLPGV